MTLRQRVLFSDNGTVSDLSLSVNDYASQNSTVAVVAAEDYLYIGSDLPFNHRYFDVATVNDQSSSISVHIWDGADWAAAVDVIDDTSAGGVCFARSGHVYWTVNRSGSWSRADDTSSVTGLTSVTIYEKYWVRLSFSGDLGASTALNYVGHKFATDEDLAVKYSDINNSSTLDAYETGKTDWDEQHFAAADDILRALRMDKAIVSSDQVLRPEVFKDAAVHKVAAIVYANFGDGYADQRQNAERAFAMAMKEPQKVVDLDADGRVDDYDRFTSARVYRV